MQQFANVEIFGIVGSVKMHHDKHTCTALIYVNVEQNSYGYHKCQKKYYVSFFQTAYTTLHPYIQPGDQIKIDKATLDIDYEKHRVYITVRDSAQVLLVHQENRSNLLARQSAGDVDPSIMQEFDLCNISKTKKLQ